MPLTTARGINKLNLVQEQMKHAHVAITDGAATIAVANETGKRISIWALYAFAAAAAKTCNVLSGSNLMFQLTSSTIDTFPLQSHDGIPVFVCNTAEDFKLDPSDATNWDFYIVYTVDTAI